MEKIPHTPYLCLLLLLNFVVSVSVSVSAESIGQLQFRFRYRAETKMVVSVVHYPNSTVWQKLVKNGLKWLTTDKKTCNLFYIFVHLQYCPFLKESVFLLAQKP